MNEVMALGRREIMNKLKPYITQGRVRINRKYMPVFEIGNVANFFLTTNHPDALIIDEDDRRYMVISSPAERRDEEYYRVLWKWSSDIDNLEALHQWFLDKDLTEFAGQGRAPFTEAKERLIEESMPPLEEWIDQRVREESWPFVNDLVSPVEIAQASNAYNLPSTPKRVAAAFRRLKYLDLGRHKWVKGKNRNIFLFAVRKFEIYGPMKQDPDQIRELYRQQADPDVEHKVEQMERQGRLKSEQENVGLSTKPM